MIDSLHPDPVDRGCNAILVSVTLGLLLTVRTAQGAAPEEPLGLRLVEVPAGEFLMGATEAFQRDLCFAERPVHRVRISQSFRIASTEVTVEQFRRFQADFAGAKDRAPYATGMSWYDAVGFCEWLSKTEGKPYRLPTEAEWEYAARQAEKLGLKNMLSGPLEWCGDWFGDYPDREQTDPVGPANGFARVVRGGCLDEPTPGFVQRLKFDAANYAHAWHRGGVAPAFGTYPGAPGNYGRHRIGFRVVQASMPATQPWPGVPRLVQQGVKDTVEQARRLPAPAKPYFRKRHLLPVPPDNSKGVADDAAGLHPSFRGHNHSPALTVCPNGDVLLVIYSSYYEYEPEVSLIACRLRLGVDQWDMPEPFVDFPSANDHAPLLFTDGGTVRLFWGCGHLPGAFPFQWIESRDSGATWSEVHFPHFAKEPGAHSHQPINSAFRGPEGTLYVASDAGGSTSVLWASDDQGKTWRDTGGRSMGRHTTYCLLKDGRLLGMGGKSSDIEGFMPGVVSGDGGRTWEKFKSVFPALSRNQRPTLLRLRSGRLFFAGDFQDNSGKQPPGITRRGCYAALSDDEGQTWHIKKLIGTQPHEGPDQCGGSDTLGYSASCQAPNGMIHLITSMTHPCLHFELNEAWILAPDTSDPGDAVLMQSAATTVAGVREHRDTYPDGKPRVHWAGGWTDDGRFLLDGKETRFYGDGPRQYEATYRLGRKIGTETLWRPDGTIAWQWKHPEDGSAGWWQWQRRNATTVTWQWQPRRGGATMQIMPMGDSITQGTGPGNCGYRHPLYDLLQAGGCRFHFVGGKTVHGDTTPESSHWGRGGWQISGTPGKVGGRSYLSLEGQNRPGLFEEMNDAISLKYFSADPAVRNVVLLMIGTNDHLHQVVDANHGSFHADANHDGQGDGQEWIAEGCIVRLQALLKEIDSRAAGLGLHLDVIVATIPTPSKAWKGDAVSDVLVGEVLRYNRWILAELPNSAYSHAKIQVVDMEKVLAGKLADGVHPNAAGYEAMAHAWYEAIGGGASVWTHYWSNGRKRSESHWRGKFADGLAIGWNDEGKELSRVQFAAGQLNTKPAEAKPARQGAGRRDPNDATSPGGATVAQEGVPCYTDRGYRIVSLPPELIGGNLVRTANQDDYSTRRDHLTLALAAPSTVFVCYWAEATDLPEWLKEEGWKRLAGQARVDIGGQAKAFNVFARAVPQGRVLLGGNERRRTGAVSMYFVVTRPAPAP